MGEGETMVRKREKMRVMLRVCGVGFRLRARKRWKKEMVVGL